MLTRIPLALRLPAAGLAAADWSAGTAAGWAAVEFGLRGGPGPAAFWAIAAFAVLFAVLRSRVFVRIVRGPPRPGTGRLDPRWPLLSLMQSLGHMPLAAFLVLGEAVLPWREPPPFPATAVGFGLIFVCLQPAGHTAELLADARRHLHTRTPAAAARGGGPA